MQTRTQLFGSTLWLGDCTLHGMRPQWRCRLGETTPLAEMITHRKDHPPVKYHTYDQSDASVRLLLLLLLMCSVVYCGTCTSND
jgi:hypothetical protein